MTPRVSWMALAAVLALTACATTPPPPPPPVETGAMLPAWIETALSDPSRPAADMARDENRRPGETLLFAGIKPGMKVADAVPGGGYFTRIFSKAVGPRGRVYAYVPGEFAAQANRDPAVAEVTRDPAYANTRMIVDTMPRFAAPERLDVVFTAQNYHDLHTKRMGPVDVARFNRQVFQSLKPGGVFIIIDHSARAGSGISAVDNLHRIDPAVVRREVEAAGFIFDGEADFLRDPGDRLTVSVFDKSIRGRTDQFVYRFRKPGRARR
ncbi:methyltransferase [Caulobacter sp. SLTY]|uniref:class I SAM-dependent methyltransferase n=1 Tax=Caulobacter sp. SLTY TaxID=2683262 RepID=UPI001412ED01|nr:class I SAM-dependent methyltransferase [Caulobacter sp. SLTY]NBB15626.1 methyltransferase [Caulobacter sp. SLTY]